MKRVLALLLVFVFLFSGCQKKKSKFTDYTFDYFDTVSTIIGYENSEQEFKQTFEKIKNELKTYHQLFDIYNSYDGINNIKTINDNAGIKAVKVDEKIIELVKFCEYAYEITGGKTNVMLGSVLKVWHDYRKEANDIPDTDTLIEADEHTSFDSLVIDEENGTVFISDEKASLDVGAVAKGFVTEKIAEMLKREGKTGYLLNIGGNIKTIGVKGDNEAWQVGIENPDTENEETPHIAYLKLNSKSVVTSGNYQRFYEFEGKRYHHIIDPETLMPSDFFASVSVVCLNSALGDALSTALFTMSLNEGKKLVENMEDVEVMWVFESGEKVYSDGFESFTFEYNGA